MSSWCRRIPISIRLIAVIILLHVPTGHARAAHALTLPGANLLRWASLALKTQPASAVARELRHHQSVADASVGLDGRTVEFRLRTGVTMAVLPAGGTSTLPLPARPLARAGAPAAGRSAFVLAPFEAEMGIQQHVDDLSARLRDYGFSVTVLTNTGVTVDDMVDLSRYDLVYDVTHSGVNQYGDVDIATGQPVDPRNVDPDLMPFIKAGSLMVTGVSGTTTDYYGIRAAWIHDELAGQFPPHSLFFLNGCSTLRGSLLWQNLQQRGLSTFVSWDNLAVTGDDAPNADAFFGGLIAGQTVDQSMSALRGRGLGVSAWAGVPAYLGYLGDGTLTLDGRSSLPPTATPTATSPPPTPTDTPTPTATVIPTPTATPVPALSLQLALHPHVRPGGRQTIEVWTAPGNRVTIRVAFPWGGGRHASRTVGSSGSTRYSYIQVAPPASSTSRRVRVTASVHALQGAASVTRTYQVTVS
jgi:hypothetical protein